MTDRIDLDKIVAEKRKVAEESDKARVEERQKNYDALLFHVEGFSYFSNRQPPTATRYGKLVFLVDEKRLKAECMDGFYRFTCLNTNAMEEKWIDWEEGQSETEACNIIADWVALKLHEAGRDDG